MTEGKDAWAAAVRFCIDTQGKGDSLAESWVPYRIIDTVAQELASALQLDFHLCVFASANIPVVCLVYTLRRACNPLNTGPGPVLVIVHHGPKVSKPHPLSETETIQTVTLRAQGPK